MNKTVGLNNIVISYIQESNSEVEIEESNVSAIEKEMEEQFKSAEIREQVTNKFINENDVLPSSTESVVKVAVPTLKKDDMDHVYNGTIIFKPSESGLANNLLGLASAFVIATLTNKKLYCKA